MVITLLVLLLQLDPFLQHQLKLLENEVMSQAIAARVPLHKIVFVCRSLLDGSVEMDPVPASRNAYQ